MQQPASVMSFNTPASWKRQFLMEIEHTFNQEVLYYKSGYHICQIDSITNHGEQYSYSVLEVSQDDYIVLLEKWYTYYQKCKFKHPIKYRRAKRLWVQHQPLRP